MFSHAAKQQAHWREILADRQPATYSGGEVLTTFLVDSFDFAKRAGPSDGPVEFLVIKPPESTFRSEVDFERFHANLAAFLELERFACLKAVAFTGTVTDAVVKVVCNARGAILETVDFTASSPPSATALATVAALCVSLRTLRVDMHHHPTETIIDTYSAFRRVARPPLSLEIHNPPARARNLLCILCQVPCVRELVVATSHSGLNSGERQPVPSGWSARSRKTKKSAMVVLTPDF